jgi:hypothetical protein
MCAHPVPVKRFSHLNFQAGSWILHQRRGADEAFDEVSVKFDAGVCLLLKLSRHEHQRTLVVFKDQLTRNQERLLWMVSKINHKTV